MSNFDLNLAKELISVFFARSLKVASVESCTGGLIGGALTSVSGSSSVVEGGLITYSNEAKRKLAHVSEASLNEYGAVSEAVAKEMALGAQKAFDTERLLSIAVTGIAGPKSDDTNKPVGMVCFGISWPENGKISCHTETQYFQNNGREYIRSETINHALKLLISKAENIS